MVHRPKAETSPDRRYIQGRPAAVAELIGLSAIQAFREHALNSDPGYTARRSPTQIASFVGRVTRSIWDDSNKSTDKALGLRYWDERVGFVLENGVPVAYLRAARNVSSGIERRFAKLGHTGVVSKATGRAERAFKRVFMASRRTFVTVGEYAALAGHQGDIPVLGAIVLNTYPDNLQVTFHALDEDERAKTAELPKFGFKPDKHPPEPREGLFGEGAGATHEGQWTAPGVGGVAAHMMQIADISELPRAEIL